jgi:hypothetical protein
MEPFNLEKAKAGDPVITRDGHRVKIYIFDAIKPDYPLVGVVFEADNHLELTEWTAEGCYYDDEPSNNDLFMGTVEHTGYIIVNSVHPDNGIFLDSIPVKIYKKAPKECDNTKVLKITWEE